MHRSIWLTVVLALGATLLVAPSGRANEPGSGQTAAAPSDELADLRAQVRQLMQRIEDIEKRQPVAMATAKPPNVAATRSRLLNISGYTQIRFLHQGLGTGGATPTTSINNRRTRLALDFSVSPRVKGFLQTDWGTTRPEGTVSLRDVYIELLTRGPSIRIGQLKFPMMIETDDGDLVVWTLERGLVTTRLIPDERDRGVMITLRDHAKDAIPVSLLFGVMNGSGINQNAPLAQKDFFVGLHYDTPKLEGRIWAETGNFQTSAPSGIVRGLRQRFALSLRGNFGNHVLPDQGKYGYRFSLMGAWARGRGDFPGRNGVNAAGLMTSGTLTYTPNRVEGWYVEPVIIVTKDPIPVRLIGRFEVFDTNRDTVFSKIYQGFVGAGFDATRHVRFILGYTPKVDQTLAAFHQRAYTVETQLAF